MVFVSESVPVPLPITPFTVAPNEALLPLNVSVRTPFAVMPPLPKTKLPLVAVQLRLPPTMSGRFSVWVSASLLVIAPVRMSELPPITKAPDVLLKVMLVAVQPTLLFVFVRRLPVAKTNALPEAGAAFQFAAVLQLLSTPEAPLQVKVAACATVANRSGSVSVRTRIHF